MYVRDLDVRDFRSWPELNVQLGPGITLFVGRNGFGKTNIVEAIGYTAHLSSHRVSHDAPLVHQGADSARVSITAVNQGRELTTHLLIKPHAANQAQINRTRLLDKLKAKNAHASFMVIAPSAEQHPELLKRMKAEGHTIGNHTKSHRQLNTLSPEQVSQEIDAGNAAIKKATGQSTRWVRPPYGATNATVDQVTRDKGVSQALWDVDTVDWKDRNSEHVCSSAVQGARAGSIVLMHDIHPTTVDAADCVIDGLRAKGLEPVSLDRLLRTPVAGKRYYARG